jgi:drug/metabolite transporter (DMT)-like permease
MSSAVASTPSRAHLGAVLMLLAMFGFAAMDTMSKLLVREYSVVQTLWVRYGIFTLFALAIARRDGIPKTLRSTRPWLQAGRSALGLVENIVFVLALSYLPLADTHAIAATAPLIVVALAAVLLGERAGLRRWLAVAAGFLGVLLIIRPGLHVLSWPVLLPLLGAGLWALYQVLTRLCASYDPPQTTLLWTAWVGFAGLTMVGPWQWHTPDAGAWVLLLATAVLGSLSHYALIRALDYAQASVVQPYSYTLLVFVTVLGWLVFGDIPDLLTVVGAAVVVASGLYTWQHDRRRDTGSLI